MGNLVLRGEGLQRNNDVAKEALRNAVAHPKPRASILLELLVVTGIIVQVTVGR
jgi:hypothetical protein